jgi:GalNAc-alpha-(1->4)-GalNAc-alpha-(1->3)-diNAcBac-PP-undecaprenol alpha-1,4-N-acetyl-D-galactosaminyltransferase
MKLLFVVKTLALPGGGAERVLATIAAALAARGHEVTIATFDDPGTTPFYSIDPSIHLLQLGIGHVRARTRLGEAVMRARSIRTMVLAKGADVAIGFMHSAYVPLALGLARTAVPVIASEHTVFGHYRRRPFERLALSIAAPFFHSMTAISERARQGFPWWLRKRMVVIGNPVQRFERMADPVGGTIKTILSVGRLAPLKDHAALISAFARIAGDFPDWRLRIVGEGRLRHSLEQQAEQTGLAARIELPGGIASIGDEYARAQLFVLPSRYESFGLATAEAMVHGLPVIGFADCPGTSEIIRDGVDGLLVDGRHRVEGLAGAMAQLMRSPEKRAAMGEAARQTEVVPRLDAVVSLWEQLLASAAAARRGTVPGATR